jgi:hypothetical protein
MATMKTMKTIPRFDEDLSIKMLAGAAYILCCCSTTVLHVVFANFRQQQDIGGCNVVPLVVE